jgi:tetratricopeptide (TPR) repeat protein
VYTRIAEAFAYRGRVSDALLVLDQATRIAQGVGLENGRAEVLTELAVQFIQIDEIDRAENLLTQAVQVAGSIESEFARGNSLEAIIIASFRGGEELFEVLRTALDQVYIIQDVGVRASLLLETARRYQESGIGQTVNTLVQQSISAATAVENPWQKAALYSEAARRFSIAGQDQESARFLQRAVREIDRVEVITRAEEDALSLVRVSRNLAALGSFDEAIRIAEQIEFPRIRAQALLSVADAYVREDRLAEASVVVSLAANLAEQNAGFVRADILAQSALRYDRLGDSSLALFYVDDVLTATTAFENDYEVAEIGRTLAPLLYENERLRDLVALAGEMEDSYIRASSAIDIASEFLTADAQQPSLSVAGFAANEAAQATYLRDNLYSDLSAFYAQVPRVEQALTSIAEIDGPYSAGLALASLGRFVEEAGGLDEGQMTAVGDIARSITRTEDG